MDRAKARFRQALARVGSATDSLEKVKALLEDVDRTWLGEPIVAIEPEAVSNGRHDETAILASPRSSVIASSDSSSKLASGERRILTALAQYADGRSKVQVAVLTGYAVSGGGFNNYLGARRSRGLITGNGDNVKITESGMHELGSWEPLPGGSGLVDYWRARLGKAERLILKL